MSNQSTAALFVGCPESSGGAPLTSAFFHEMDGSFDEVEGSFGM